MASGRACAETLDLVFNRIKMKLMRVLLLERKQEQRRGHDPQLLLLLWRLLRRKPCAWFEVPAFGKFLGGSNESLRVSHVRRLLLQPT